MRLRVLSILILILPTFPVTALRAEPYGQNIARAEAYLVNHFNPSVGLIYESEDPGQHWLTSELQSFHWKYNQTYWLYSDNFFTYLALQHDFPEISNQIRRTIDFYHQTLPNLFEVVAGENIHLPLHNSQDIIIAKNENFVIMMRRHNASSLALGTYVDFWMYEALEHALEGDLASAAFLVHQAEQLWFANGLWDWSYTIYDHMFSNQKLALLIFTARAIGVHLEHESEMEAHLWSMQNNDGGIASLSYPSGKKAGSGNAETTALSILAYDNSLLSMFPKIQETLQEHEVSTLMPALMALVILLALFLAVWGRKNRRLCVVK
jgi:hypothetical protein